MPPDEVLETRGVIGQEFDLRLIMSVTPAALAVLMHDPRFLGS